MANSRVKWLRTLKERRGRESSGALLVEGPRAIEQALFSGTAPILVVYCEQLITGHGRAHDLLAAIPASTTILELDRKAFVTVSDTVHSQGIVAALPIRDWQPQPFASQTNTVLVLDNVRDPGNVGTLIRSAAAAGADAVLLSRGCADPYNPKVVRASAGAIFATNVAVLEPSEIARLLETLPKRYAASGEASVTCYEADLTSPCAILIGNESTGLSEDIRSLSTDAVSIPMERNIESLNAGVAGSILMFESQRQRRVKLNGA